MSSHKWASLLKHKTTRSNGETPHLPQVGELIEITAQIEVYILDFETAGEEHLVGSPIGRVRANRDFTGVVLTPGMKVRIKRIDKGKVAGSLQSVWALVAAP